ncbi:MAG: DoxX family protein [Alphaproteobacteria bacterium]|jgi:putative oxidoreductase
MGNDNEPKLVLPFLKPFYDVVIPLSWPLIRCSVGLILAVHGSGKVERVFDLIVGNPTRGNAAQVVVLMFIEFFGGICIALGLFIRFWAPAAAIELGYITLVRYSDHFGWRTDGYEYVLMWRLLLFAISLRGGGPYSLDLKIGKTL